MSSENDNVLDEIREREQEWLYDMLERSIANLGYPVGCGLAPHPESLRKAAGMLFERTEHIAKIATGMERERCAKVAETCTVKRDWVSEIAHAIRNPLPTENSKP